MSVLPDTLEHMAVLTGSYSVVLYKKVHIGKIKGTREAASAGGRHMPLLVESTSEIKAKILTQAVFG